LPKQNRGYRYQVADKARLGLWVVLDMFEGEGDNHPIVASELSRSAARAKAKELNLVWRATSELAKEKT
jgi:hypothetical protein